MSQRMTQYKGIDTKVEQFAPSRANPVASRRVRSYYAQQPVNGTSRFENLTFQIDQTNPKNVINEMRMVFPLELRAWGREADGDNTRVVNLPLHTNTWKRASNIAVAQNAPFSAFSNLEIAINGKVYSEQFPAYGKVLGQCFQSYSELQFQNDESLKPIANNNMGQKPTTKTIKVAVIADDGSEEKQEEEREIIVTDFHTDPKSFSLLENNSGFIARARRFQSQLTDEGKCWKGEISSLFNASLFNAEARRSGNDQIPYVQNIFINAVFDTNPCGFDKKHTQAEEYIAPNYSTVVPGAKYEGYERIIPPKLFEFLTSINSGFPYEVREPLHYEYPVFYTLKWTGQPRIDIEWVTYSQNLLAPAYKLRGLRYQHEETLPFQIPWRKEIENRQWVSTTLQRQLLQVPNLIYIWAAPTRASHADMFGMGGCFRTCDIKQNSLKVRVNGSVDIIQGPSNELLYKWFKRNTNSVFEFPTWEKNKVIVLSPSEIGLSEWLANQASVSTLDISLETSHSTLMHPEYQRIAQIGGLVGSGYDEEDERSVTTDMGFVVPLNAKHNTVNMFSFPLTIQTEMLTFASLKLLLESDQTEMWLNIHARKKEHLSPYSYNGAHEMTQSLLPINIEPYKVLFTNDKVSTLELRYQLNASEFKVTRVRNMHFRWSGGRTYWIQVNPTTHDIQTDAQDQVIMWSTELTHYFSHYMDDKDPTYIEELQWDMLINDQNNMPNKASEDFMIVSTAFTGANYNSTTARAAWWNRVYDCADSLESHVYFNRGNSQADWKHSLDGYNFLLNKVEQGSTLEEQVDIIGGYCDDLVSIAPVMSMFHLNLSTGHTPIEHEFNHNWGNSGIVGALTRSQVKDGWRWVKMAEPSNDYTHDATGQDNNCPFTYTKNGIEAVHRPRQEAIFKTRVLRNQGLQGAEDVAFDTDNYDHRDIRGYAPVDDERNINRMVETKEYSLNVLLEYNNETVLMTQDRSKPVHFPNLMYPQGRGPLPSQEDAYLNS